MHLINIQIYLTDEAMAQQQFSALLPIKQYLSAQQTTIRESMLQQRQQHSMTTPRTPIPATSCIARPWPYILAESISNSDTFRQSP